jgi:hypothetical protein
MHRKLILTALASAAILCGGQALAAAGPGGGGGPGGGRGGGMGNMGGGGIGNMGRGGMGDMDGVGGMIRDDGRINSEGPDHASANGIANASANSVLAGTTATTRVASGALAGVADGMSVFSNGTLVGTVQQIRLAGNGNVALLLVKGTNGGIFPVPANKLTLANGTLSTTARLRGINDAEVQGRLNSQGPMHASATGIAHANQHSVLAGATLTGPTGISVGMPLFENGTRIGTVSRVITANGTIRRVLVQRLNGRTLSLSPTMLTASNGMLTTTASLRGM